MWALGEGLEEALIPSHALLIYVAECFFLPSVQTFLRRDLIRDCGFLKHVLGRLLTKRLASRKGQGWRL